MMILRSAIVLISLVVLFQQTKIGGCGERLGPMHLRDKGKKKTIKTQKDSKTQARLGTKLLLTGLAPRNSSYTDAEFDSS